MCCVSGARARVYTAILCACVRARARVRLLLLTPSLAHLAYLYPPQANDLNYTSIGEDEKKEIEDELKAVYAPYHRHNDKLSMDQTFQRLKYYQVPFTQVLDLVKRRRVFLKDGFAFVPHSQLLSIIQARFRLNLSRELTDTSKRIAHVYQDDRITPFLKNLSSINLGGTDYSKGAANGLAVTPDMVESLSQSSFPMCMRELHGNLKRNSHLKHSGRMQVGYPTYDMY